MSLNRELTAAERIRCKFSNEAELIEYMFQGASKLRMATFKGVRGPEIGLVVGAINGDGNKYYINSESQMGVLGMYKYLIVAVADISTSTNKKPTLKVVASKDARLDKVNSLSQVSPHFNKVLVSDYVHSYKLFGLLDVKKSMVNTKLTKFEIDFGESARLGDSTYFINLPHPSEERFIKFSIADVTFEMLDYSKWSLPKDKTITVGDSVVINKTKLIDSGSWTVKEIYRNPTSKLLHKNSLNGSKDIMVLTQGGVVKKVYAKFLKKTT